MAQRNDVDLALTEDAMISMISACASSPAHCLVHLEKLLVVVFSFVAFLVPEAAQQRII